MSSSEIYLERMLEFAREAGGIAMDLISKKRSRPQERPLHYYTGGQNDFQACPSET